MNFVRFIVIDGTMFGGKTDETIRQARRLLHVKKKVVFFRHKKSVRPGEEDVVITHDGVALRGIDVYELDDNEEGKILEIGKHYDAVFVEEGQWFKPVVASILLALFRMGKFILYNGLLVDFRGEFFEPTLACIAIPEAEHVRCNGVCSRCGQKEATRHLKYVNGKLATKESPRLEAGSEEMYEIACLPCCDQAYVAAGLSF